eukprot:SAG22_NODE_1806_length_3531_cov_2.206294_5_plen_95_part_00
MQSSAPKMSVRSLRTSGQMCTTQEMAVKFTTIHGLRAATRPTCRSFVATTSPTSFWTWTMLGAGSPAGVVVGAYGGGSPDVLDLLLGSSSDEED